ncbi:DUF3306 domain-containing protein [Halomonas halodenitrificans]|uniref:DUF3306 domain-containing protein n=1 Tax=Halomonas halodenitrificans TaxID=28252 RepID=UPI0006886EE2|nr:DUF3306 domain-containing protein [Halomonas halodenitrificans]
MSRLDRWSRRKLGEDVESAPEREPVEAFDKETLDKGPFDKESFDKKPLDKALIHEEPVEAHHEEPAAPGSLDHTLPDPDALPAEADFSAYLKQGVSQQLRRRALRRLWSTGDYGIRDGLDDYDENYREILKPLSRDIAERLRRWTRPDEAATTPEPPAPGDEALADAAGSDEAPHQRDNKAEETEERGESGKGGGSRETEESDSEEATPPEFATAKTTTDKKTAADKALDEAPIGDDNTIG